MASGKQCSLDQFLTHHSASFRDNSADISSASDDDYPLSTYSSYVSDSESILFSSAIVEIL